MFGPLRWERKETLTLFILPLSFLDGAEAAVQEGEEEASECIWTALCR